MRKYDLTSFNEGISCTLVDFKKDFAKAIKVNKWSAKQVKEAHKIAVKGNKIDGDIKPSISKRKETE